MIWAFIIILLVLALAAETVLLVRATRRLLQFDAVFQMIVEPMQEYSIVLRKLSSGEGLLHDHPEVMEFHRANLFLLTQMDAAIRAVREEHPEKKRAKFPRPEAE
jgi:hypothetical protein